MAVNQAVLQKYKKMYTMKDFEDGKCDINGLPVVKEEKVNDPEVKPEVLPEVKEAEESEAQSKATSDTKADDGRSVPKIIKSKGGK